MKIATSRTRKQMDEFKMAAAARCCDPSEDPCECQCKSRSPVRVGWAGETTYEELPDKPSINGVEIIGDENGNHYGLANLSDVKNGSLTIKDSDGNVLGTFTANQADNVVITVSAGGVEPGNGKLTLKKTDGTVLGTFTANQTTDTDITVATTDPGNGKLTIRQNAATVGEFTANQGTDTVVSFVAPDWRESDPNAASFIQNKPDLSSLGPAIPGATSLDQLIIQYNALLNVLKGTSGGYDFSSVPTLTVGNTQSAFRSAMNLTIAIATPMGGMPGTLPITATDANMSTTFNALKAAIQTAGRYDVSSVADMTATDTEATFRALFNALVAILKSHT